MSVICIYCGSDFDNPAKAQEHVSACQERPEGQLLLRISILELEGDRLLENLHGLTRAVAEIDGMRTQVWQIYHDAKDSWEHVKSVRNPAFLREIREALLKRKADQQSTQK